MNTLPGVRGRGRWLSALNLLLVVVRASVGSLVVVGTGVAQDTPPRWEMTEELRIGAVEGPNALSAAHRLTVDARGERVYVPQEMSGRVRVFDARSGESLYAIGRSGEGPGEFREIGAVGWVADTVYVTDFLLNRVSYFSREGDHFRTGPLLRLKDVDGHNGLIPIGVTASGRVVVQELLLTRQVADGSSDGSPWMIQGSSDEDWQVLAARNLQGTRTALPLGEWVVFLVQPYAQRSLIALQPDGRSIAVLNQPGGDDSPGNYELSRFNSEGQRRSRWHFTYEPQPLPASIADSILAVNAEGLQRWVPEGRAVRLAEQHMVIPKAFPPVKRMVVARDGDVWIRQGGVERTTASWLVIDPHGEYRAVVRAPSEVDLKYVDGDTAWGIVYDDLDVPYVVRMRLLK